MQDEAYIRIPLGGRFKSKPVTAWTIVDAADAPFLLASRWHLNRPEGYAIRSVRLSDDTYSRYRRERMSRVILRLEWGDPREADHINGDTLDNRRANLRIATHAQNLQNMTAHRDARSPYRGVDWFKPHGKWRARACIAGVTHYLGYFSDELMAAEAARAFREAHMTHNVESRH